MRQLSLTFPRVAQIAPCAALPVRGRPSTPGNKTPQNQSSRVSAGAKKSANAIKEDTRKPWQKAPLKDRAAEAKLKHPKRSPAPSGIVSIKVTA